MAEKCLTQGSVLIPAVADRLRLYSMRFCPYAQRTRLVLQHKRIPHEIINVNLKHKPSWLLARNPAGLVPIIEYRGHVIIESAVCDEFLEEMYPQAPLMPRCPFERARQRLLMQAFDKDIPAVYGMMSRKQEKRTESGKRIGSMLTRHESLLRASNTRFMSSNEVQLIDYHFYPWFERFPAFSQLRGVSEGGPAVMSVSEYPRLTAWVEAMSTLEAVKATRLPINWHAEFILSLANKDPQYDIGLEPESSVAVARL